MYQKVNSTNQKEKIFFFKNFTVYLNAQLCVKFFVLAKVLPRFQYIISMRE